MFPEEVNAMGMILNPKVGIFPRFQDRKIRIKPLHCDVSLCVQWFVRILSLQLSREPTMAQTLGLFDA